jgi:hypothetical protein
MNHPLPFVAQALNRWTVGIAADRIPSAKWFRAMATRLHCASLQVAEPYWQRVLARSAGQAAEYAVLAA